VFFDSGHPSEKAYQQFAEQMWSGPPNVTGPYNLKALFEHSGTEPEFEFGGGQCIIQHSGTEPEFEIGGGQCII
jgi:hypothetical protein